MHCLFTGLGLGTQLQSHATPRSTSSLPPVPSSYAHTLHASLLDVVNPSPYKSPFASIETQSALRPEQTSFYGFSPHSSKPVFPETLIKDGSYFSSQSTQQQNTEKMAKSLGWNFASQSNIYGTPELSSSDLPGPPPAHSGNSSRNAIQRAERNTLPPDLFDTTSTKNSNDLILASQATLAGLRHDAASLLLQQSANRGIEDLTKTSTHTSNVFSYGNTSVVPKIESSSSYQQQMSLDMNYDPVTPPPSTLPENEDVTFNTVNMNDLSGLANTSVHKQNRNLSAGNLQKHNVRMMQQESHHGSSNKSSHHAIQSIPPDGLRNMKMNDAIRSSMSPSVHSQNPLQQRSPLNSPLMTMSNQQIMQTSASVIQQPPIPVQAVADSTTKPKKPRSRKKKDSIQQIVKDNGSMVNQKINMMQQQPNQGSMMDMNSQGYNPYSPQKPQPFSPHSNQQPQQASPKKSQSVSPQAYSPQLGGQNLHSQNQNSPLNDHYPMQPPSQRAPSALGHQNSNQVPASSPSGMKLQTNHLPHATDSIIRSGRTSLQSLQNISAHQQQHQNLSCAVSSPQEMQHQRQSMSQNMSMADSMSMTSAQIADVMGTGNPTFSYNPLNQPLMDTPLSLPPLDLPDHANQFVSPHGSAFMQQSGSYVPQGQDSIYTDLDNYNAQFENHQNTMTSPMGYEPNTSTIDEAALSSIMRNNGTLQDPSNQMHNGMPPDMWNRHVEEKPARAITTNVEFDDEFQHLSKPPKSTQSDKPKTAGGMNNMENIRSSSNSLNVIPNSAPVSNPVQINPPQNPTAKKGPANTGFLNSFLSFIGGKKPETLSSVNTAQVKRPELPKYIPEPRRPRPVQPPPKPSPIKKHKHSDMAFSDSDDDSNMSNTVQNVISHLGDHKHEKRESLKMKISLKGVKRKQSSSSLSYSVTKGTKKNKKKSRSLSKSRGSSADEDYQVVSSEEEMTSRSPTRSPVAQPRKLSSRKAKEQGLQKRSKS